LPVEIDIFEEIKEMANNRRHFSEWKSTLLSQRNFSNFGVDKNLKLSRRTYI
jgi:hypothetical protein